MNLFNLKITFLLIGITMKLAYGQQKSEKLFSFGVLADIQYADADKKGKRDYRNSLSKLENCITEFNKYELSFVVSLGDVIDKDYESFDKPLAILDKSKAKVYNIIGNHEYAIDDQYKGGVKKRLNNKKGYFDFEVGNLVFLVVDGSDLSMLAYAKGSEKYKEGLAKLEEIKKAGGNNAYDWNGGIGDEQFSWLEKRLEKAESKNKKVVLFCHWPLLPENGTQLWNNKKVLELIEGKKSVVAWVSGHHHSGGYEKVNGIHHLTMKGMVEATKETSCGIMDVYADKLMLIGLGDQPDQIMSF